MTETLKIAYPTSASAKKLWNKQYGTNAYWAGKHRAERAEDARFWHALTTVAMERAGVRKRPFENPVVITFHWNDGLDLDNHSMMAKMIVDSLKKRLINDDSRRWVQGIEHYWHNEPCIKIVVREIGVE